MRVWWVLCFAPLVLLAQTPPLVRGVVVTCEAHNGAGELVVRTRTDQVFRYQFDRKTYAERDDRMIEAGRLLPGEPVEVVSDQVPGMTLRYARTIHVIPPAPPPRPLTAGRYRPYHSAEERALPLGNLTFSGVVYRLESGSFVLHTREDGDQTIRLRKDTRYLENGEIVDAATLRPNTRVFVRAGKDAYDKIEAYQVVWGKILEPRE